jgi:hypothetical protein
MMDVPLHNFSQAAAAASDKLDVSVEWTYHAFNRTCSLFEVLPPPPTPPPTPWYAPQ